MLREWEKQLPGPHRIDLQRAGQRRADAPARSRAARLRRAFARPASRRPTATSRSTPTIRSRAKRRARDRDRRRALTRSDDIAVRANAMHDAFAAAARHLALLALAVACCIAARAAADPPDSLAGTALRRPRCARGGYVLYFRHASTDFGQNDDKMTGYEDCAQQRNLTDRGRAEARAIGAAIQAAAHSRRRRAREPVLPHARNRRAHLRPRDGRCARARRPGARPTMRSATRR